MNVKAFAHQTHARIAAASGLTIKRTHIYELTAAAYGDKSYAALKARGLLCPMPSDALEDRYAQLDPSVAEQRAQLLGYAPNEASPVAALICAELRSEKLGVVPIDDVLHHLLFGQLEIEAETTPTDTNSWEWDEEEARHEDSNYDYPLGLNLHSAWIVDGLQAAVDGNDGRAHVALALLLESVSNEEGDEDDYKHEPDNQSGLYWYERQQQGEVLTGVEKEWADGFAALLQIRSKSHAGRGSRANTVKSLLQRGAELGQHDALLLLADRYGDDRFFDLKEPNVQADPLWIADLADRVGRYEWTLAWTVLAAEQGSIPAMKHLLQTNHRLDPLKAWTWFSLSKLLGTDLTRDNYRAIHEDGSSYDDDVGGPMFADGEDGVLLPVADEQTKARANTSAQAFFRALQRARNTSASR